MLLASPASPPRGRRATRTWLRLLAAVLALVLSASGLSQAAHFLLVPHTICLEHGELLELGEAASHDDRATADDSAEPRAAEHELSAEHEHCQVLARGQREHALPPVSTAQLQPAPTRVNAADFADFDAAAGQLSRLALAPKTSPPRSPSC
jgi:hypothetical protein